MLTRAILQINKSICNSYIAESSSALSSKETESSEKMKFMVKVEAYTKWIDPVVLDKLGRDQIRMC